VNVGQAQGPKGRVPLRAAIFSVARTARPALTSVGPCLPCLRPVAL
jgi:cyanate permease